MVSIIKETFLLGIDSINDIIETVLPTLSLADLKADPVGIKAEWSAAIIALTELENVQTEWKDAKNSWFEVIKKMPEMNKPTAEADYEKFMRDNDLNNLTRRLNYKIRDMKKGVGEWAALSEQYAADKRVEDGDESRFHTEEQAKLTRDALDSLARALGEMRGGRRADDADFAAPPSRGISLPPIQLPKFKGLTREWPEFWDQYKIGIHADTGLPPAKKLIYLKTLLEGEARDLVVSLPNENANYDIAVKLLESKYGDEKAIIRQLHMDLVNLKGSQSFSDDNKLALEAEKILRRLETYKEDMNNPHFLIALQNKLSKPTLRKVLDIKNNLPTGQAWDTKKFRSALSTVLQRESEVEQIYTQNKSIKKEPPPVKERKYGQQILSNDQTMAFAAVGKEPFGFQRKNALGSNAAKRGTFSNRKKFCRLCETEGHWTAECKKYPRFGERLERAQKIKLCTRCLSKEHQWSCDRTLNPCFFCKSRGHVSAMCKDKFRSRQTVSLVVEANDYESEEEEEKEDEPILLYESEEENEEKEEGNEEVEEETETAAITQSCSQSKARIRRLLLSAKAPIFNTKYPNKSSMALIVFDGGCERTFIRKQKAIELGLPTFGTDHLSLSGFMEMDLGNHTAPATKFGIQGNGKAILIEANVIDKILKPVYHVPFGNIKEFDSEEIPTLADLERPDVLIGIDQIRCFELEDRKQMPNGFWITDSIIGPMISGKGFTKILRQEETVNSVITATTNEIVEDEETSFSSLMWKGDWFPSVANLDLNDSVHSDKEVWDKALQIENIDGKYHVSLPFNEQVNSLDSNYGLAFGRLKSNLKNMRQRPVLLKKYDDILKEQLKLGTIEKVKNPKKWTEVLNYVPHQPVCREDKATTKVRIVNDASARIGKGLSLNDCLMKGPNTLNDIAGVLIRSRIPQLLIGGDIEKAFLQISIKKEHRDALRFIWSDKPEDEEAPFTIYNHVGLPFGLICSPAILGTVVNYHLDHIGTDMAKNVKKNIYVDNLFYGIDDINQIEETYKTLKEMFTSAKMNLREFFVNSKEGMNQIPVVDRAKTDHLKLLGIKWDPFADHFTIELPEFKLGSKMTKRSLLAFINQVYDTQGWSCPALLSAKRLQQKIWKEKLDWDDEIPENLQKEWLEIVNKWKGCKFQIPRKLFYQTLSESDKLSIHTFSDASIYAYGIAVYLMIENENGIVMKLLQGKSLVKPTNTPKAQDTIPKMELHALKLAVRLALRVQSELKEELKVDKLVFYTDAKDAIDWLKSHKRHERYIENRVLFIRPYSVKHIPGEWNPSDVASRGCTPEELMNHDLWFNGPIAWLMQPDHTLSEYDPEVWENEKDEAQELVMTITEEPNTELILFKYVTKYNSWNKVKRVAAYVVRYIKCLGLKDKQRKPVPKDEEEVSLMIEKAVDIPAAEELEIAEERLILEAQIQYPPSKSLCHEKQMRKNERGLWISQSRLAMSNLTVEAITPIYLPKQAHITKLIILNTHWNLLHAETTTVVTKLRQKFFMSRRTVQDTLFRSREYKCRVCVRWKTKALELPSVPPLPTFRVDGNRPFKFVGIDGFGPMKVKIAKERMKKVWGIIFTCTFTRAVHIEIVDDCTSEEFLLAFRRFCARRLEPELVVSDNAQQFKLASRAIEKLWSREKKEWAKVLSDNKVREFLSENGIKWKFIVEKASWMGGFWEKMIDLIKKVMTRTLGTQIIYRSELETLLSEVERVVNSRPLTYTVQDGIEIPLCPNDFLIPYKTSSFRENKLEEDIASKQNREKFLHSQQRVQDNIQTMWKMFENEYLLALRDAHKYKKRGKQHLPELGGTILVHDEAQPKSRWRLGVITEYIESADKERRSAKIRVWDGHKNIIIQRPINKIYPLEIPDNQNAESQDEEKEGEKQINTINCLISSSAGMDDGVSLDCGSEDESIGEQQHSNTLLSGASSSNVNPQTLLSGAVGVTFLQCWNPADECIKQHGHTHCQQIQLGELLEFDLIRGDNIRIDPAIPIRQPSVLKLATILWHLIFARNPDHDWIEEMCVHGTVSDCLKDIRFDHIVRSGKKKLNTKLAAMKQMSVNKINGTLNGLKFTLPELRQLFKLWANKCQLAAQQLSSAPWACVELELPADQLDMETFTEAWARIVTEERLPMNFREVPKMVKANVLIIGDKLAKQLGEAFGKSFVWSPDNTQNIHETMDTKLFIGYEVETVVLWLSVDEHSANRLLLIWVEMTRMFTKRRLPCVFIMPPWNEKKQKDWCQARDNFNLMREEVENSEERGLIKLMIPGCADPQFPSLTVNGTPTDEAMAEVIQTLENWNVSNEPKAKTWQERKMERKPMAQQQSAADQPSTSAEAAITEISRKRKVEEVQPKPKGKSLEDKLADLLKRMPMPTRDGLSDQQPVERQRQVALDDLSDQHSKRKHLQVTSEAEPRKKKPVPSPNPIQPSSRRIWELNPKEAYARGFPEVPRDYPQRSPHLEIKRAENGSLYLGFFGPTFFTSNFFEAPFKLGSDWYPTSEHYYQIQKCEEFGFMQTAVEISKTLDPFIAKKLAKGDRLIQLHQEGRENNTRKFTSAEWQNKCRAVMEEALHEKFSQNVKLLDWLMKTGDAYLAEVAFDKFWGTLGKLDDRAHTKYPASWEGHNWLGRLLMKTRHKLKPVSTPSSPIQEETVLSEPMALSEPMEAEGSSEGSSLSTDVAVSGTDAFSAEIADYYQMNKQQEGSYQEKVKIVEGLKRIVGALGNIHMYGSSASYVGTNSSDIDLVILPKAELVNLDALAQDYKYQREMLYTIKMLPFRGYRRTVKGGKVPVLAMDSIEQDKPHVDITFGNELGKRNTEWFNKLCEKEERLAPIVFLIKQWAKLHQINDAAAHTLNSWSLGLMTIFFLQQCKPPAICLKPDLSDLQATDNEQGVGELVKGFFNYYATFPFASKGISIREGKPCQRKGTAYIEIEEPLQPTRNTAASTQHQESFVKINKAVRKTKEDLKEKASLSSMGISHKKRLSSVVSVMMILSMLITGANCSKTSMMMCDPSVERFYYRTRQQAHEACQSHLSGEDIVHELSIYRPNDDWVELEAHSCKIVKQKIKYWKNLINEKRSNVTQSMMPISKEDCWQMVKRQQCSEGNMTGNPMAKTNNEFDPAIDFSYFSTKSAQAKNCYYNPTKLFYNPFSREMAYPMDSLKGCEIEDEMCKLGSGEVLVWKKRQNFKICHWKHWQRANGTLEDDVWTRTDGQFALSFRTILNNEIDCNQHLVMTDQHYAVSSSSYEWMMAQFRLKQQGRSKRSPVRSEQLAAVTTMASFLANKKDKALFYNLLCEQNIDFRSIDATNVIRKLLNNSYVQARWIGPSDIMEVWPCTPIDDFAFTFIKEGENCYQKLPVNASFGGEMVQGFLESDTMIVVENSPTGPCTIFGKQAIEVNGTVYIIDQQNGKIDILPDEDIREIDTYQGEGIPSFKPEIFVNLAITNTSETEMFLKYLNAFRARTQFKKGRKNDWNTQIGDYVPQLEVGVWDLVKKYLWKDWDMWIIRAWVGGSIIYFFRKYALPKLIEIGLTGNKQIRDLIINLILQRIEEQREHAHRRIGHAAMDEEDDEEFWAEGPLNPAGLFTGDIEGLA